MNRIITFFICIFCAFSATNAKSQALGKGIQASRQAGTAATKAAMTAEQSMLKTTNAALRNVPRTAAPAVKLAPAVKPVPLPAVNPTVAGFVDRNQRTLFKLQTSVGVSTRKAWENLKNLGAEYHPKNPRPELLQSSAFTAADFTKLAVSQAEITTAPLFPFQNQRLLIYRGMALNTNGDAIRNILENGLLTKDVGRESNTLLLSIAGPRGRAGAARTPITNLTDNSSEAVMWAGKRMGKQDITVVVAVNSSAKGSIITVAEDIPAEDIYAVTALLRVNGKPTWCKLETAPEGFRITPYQEAAIAE